MWIYPVGISLPAFAKLLILACPTLYIIYNYQHYIYTIKIYSCSPHLPPSFHCHRPYRGTELASTARTVEPLKKAIFTFVWNLIRSNVQLNGFYT